MNNNKIRYAFLLLTVFFLLSSGVNLVTAQNATTGGTRDTVPKLHYKLDDSRYPYQTTENYLAAVNDSSILEYRFIKKASHGMLHPKLQWDYVRALLKWLRL